MKALRFLMIFILFLLGGCAPILSELDWSLHEGPEIRKKIDEQNRRMDSMYGKILKTEYIVQQNEQKVSEIFIRQEQQAQVVIPKVEESQGYQMLEKKVEKIDQKVDITNRKVDQIRNEQDFLKEKTAQNEENINLNSQKYYAWISGFEKNSSILNKRQEEEIKTLAQWVREKKVKIERPIEGFSSKDEDSSMALRRAKEVKAEFMDNLGALLPVPWLGDVLWLDYLNSQSGGVTDKYGSPSRNRRIRFTIIKRD